MPRGRRRRAPAAGTAMGAAEPAVAAPAARARRPAGPGGRPALLHLLPSAVLAGLEDWAPTFARLALGAVFLWFGSGELWQPRLWTGYVPLLPQSSGLTALLVLAHGALLLLLATALLFGIAPRVAAGIGAVLLVEIVMALTIQAGLNDIAVRDLGVLGLALAVAGSARHRLLLTR